jgi:DNA transformation protein
MSATDEFDAWVLERLQQRLADVRARSMFGGRGLYAGNTFFGILYKQVLYFYTDEKTREAYLDAGSRPFEPTSKQTLHHYYEVPVDIVEDDEQLNAWAVVAIMTRRRQGA